MKRFIILVAVLLLVGGGCINQSKQTKTSSESTSSTGLKKFSNKKLNISFDYPATWTYRDNNDPRSEIYDPTIDLMDGDFPAMSIYPPDQEFDAGWYRKKVEEKTITTTDNTKINYTLYRSCENVREMLDKKKDCKFGSQHEGFVVAETKEKVRLIFWLIGVEYDSQEDIKLRALFESILKSVGKP